MGQNINDLSLPSQADPLSMAREGSSCSSLGEAGDSTAGSGSWEGWFEVR